MKKSTLALAFGAAALLVGCGGGGGGATNTTGNGGGTSSSSTGTGGGSSSSSGNNGGTQAPSLTLNSVDDIKGYTLKTNRSTIDAGSFSVHQTITLAIGCDGSFTYTIMNDGNGYSASDVGTGTEVTLDKSFDPYELTWYGTWNGGDAFEAGDTAGDTLTLNDTNRIYAGQTCWMDFGGNESGADCPNNLYIETITQDEVCQ